MPHENEITDWLLDLMRALSPRMVARGLRQGFGVLGTPTAEQWEVWGRTEYLALDGKGGADVPTVLVGLNSDGRVEWPAVGQVPGSLVDGVIAVPGKLVVL